MKHLGLHMLWKVIMHENIVLKARRATGGDKRRATPGSVQHHNIRPLQRTQYPLNPDAPPPRPCWLPLTPPIPRRRCPPWPTSLTGCRRRMCEPTFFYNVLLACCSGLSMLLAVRGFSEL